MKRSCPLYIDGEWRQASDGATFEVINPADESLVGYAADGTVEDVAAAVAAARKAFDSLDWSRDRAFRKHCLMQLKVALIEQIDEIRALQIEEAGICAAVASLVDVVIGEMDYPIGLIDAFEWSKDFPAHEMFGMRSLRKVTHEPYGVVAAITPWNAPFLINLWKTVPALATGNVVVLKGAPETPLSGGLLAAAIDKTDIPKGVFNLISSINNVVGGDALTGDARIDMFHFTGSTGVGERIAARAALGVRKVVLELGGKSANIVLEDADLDMAIPVSVGNCMMNSGQGCTLGTRLVVPAKIYDEVKDRLRVVGSQIPLGDPREPGTVVGPIIRQSQLDRMDALVSRAIADGAELLTGGRKAERDGRGFWYEPTILADVDENSELAQTEVFGPVLAVIKYDGTDAEAIRISNNTRYGLSGYVQTRDLERAQRIASRMRTGTVNINNSLHNSPSTPFGGYGLSGLGREHGIEGWQEFLQTKTVSIPA